MITVQIRSKNGKTHPLPPGVTVEIVEEGKMAGVVIPSPGRVKVLTPGDSEFDQYVAVVGSGVADVAVQKAPVR